MKMTKRLMTILLAITIAVVSSLPRPLILRPITYQPQDDIIIPPPDKND